VHPFFQDIQRFKCSIRGLMCFGDETCDAEHKDEEAPPPVELPTEVNDPRQTELFAADELERNP